MDDNRYYVYQLIDPRDNTIFYVGKGCGYRYTHHVAEAHRPPILWSNTMKCLRILAIERTGQKVRSIKSHTSLSEVQAHAIEYHMINQYGCIIDGTGCLTNSQRHSTYTPHTNTKQTKQQLCQFTIAGELIATHVSASCAAHTINTRVSNILSCCNGKTKQAKGYVWRWEGDTTTTFKESHYHANRRKQVVQKSLIGDTIATFISIRQAAERTGINHSNICKCCNGTGQKTAGGFVWEYVIP